MNKAIFIDRDGVINRNDDMYYVYTIENLRLNEGIIEALKTLRENGFLLIIISNQSGIAKGIYTRQDTDIVHNHLARIFSTNGILISEIYYCPHHPDIGLCFCRKPESLMIDKAIARFNIDPKQSWMIGDGERDVEAGKKAGVKTILLKRNEDIRNYLDDILS